MRPHQERLLQLLLEHRPADEVERAHLEHLAGFVRAEPACFGRATLPGHITGSAFVVDAERGALLLHHHRKLDRWLQLGGHDEGEQDAAATALREAREESGLTRLALEVPTRILDVDVHAIPARPGEPGHLHLDVRFLVLADGAEPLRLDLAESKALAWVPFEEAAARMGEVGAQRVVTKLRARLAAGRSLPGPRPAPAWSIHFA